MQKISGKEKTVNELLADKKYTIHYYQREYRWGKKQIEELLDDLAEEFLENYGEGHERPDVAKYGHYYLGSVVLTTGEGENAIIDGQQRLTSLTLLLIYLNNLQQDKPERERVQIQKLIYSDLYGRLSFNIHVEEREPCLIALFRGEKISPDGQPESVKNILSRFQDIEDIFPEELKEAALPFFIDWLQHKVYLVEITAVTEQDAHKIFVTMNDRGLNLTPTEMLKGYLLSEIADDKTRNRANDKWKEKVHQIKSLDEESKEEDSDFIKNWLRARYAETIRETKAGAEKEDFDLIGTEFHKWVRENAKRMGLNRSDDFENFVLREFDLFASTYIRLKEYSKKLHSGFEYVFYNAQLNFTLQNQLILASLLSTDDKDTINRKIKIVSCFLDHYINVRAINFKSVDYSTIKNAMFTLTKKIRANCDDIGKLVILLQQEIRTMDTTWEGVDRFYLNNFSKRYILHLLARMTHFIESGCGLNTRFEDYISRTIKNPFDIEHIWADHWERHRDEFDSEEEFGSFRNRFGGLILLPRDKNRSFNDKKYTDKLPMYFGENMLAKTLHLNCYINNPQFLNFKEISGLNFQSITEFKKQDLIARQQLYKSICKQIWNIDNIADSAK